MAVTHSYVSTAPAVSGKVDSTQWNAEHTISFWDDLRVEPTVRAAAGSGVPSFSQWYSDGASSVGVYLYNFSDESNAVNEKSLFFNMQMPHGWKATDIHLHVHWVGSISLGTATPRWGLEYAWKDIGATYGTTTTIYATGNVNGDTDIVANKHYLSEFADITPGTTADGLSSIMLARIFRNSSNAADTYTAGVCGMLYIDAHIEYDQIGSDSEFVK